MAFRRVQNLGTVTASTLGDDAAHSLTGLVISPNSGVRVNEFAGNDVFVKLTLAGTAVTATNGTYIKASSSLIIHPEEKPQNGKTVLQYNRAEDNFTLSVKNETNGSDGGVHVEEVTFVQTV